METTPAQVGGLFNLRDLGGYWTTGDASVRRKFIYRCGNLHHINTTGWETLREMGVSVIIDFTSAGESRMFSGAAAEPEVPDWVQVIRIPFSDGPLCLDRETEKYKGYRDTGNLAIAEQYLKTLQTKPGIIRQVLLCILAHQQSTILIHCALGKDRTGIISALLLSLAGVPDHVVAIEYSHSGPCLEHLRPRIIQLALATDPDVRDVAGLATFSIQCSGEIMGSTLDLVKEHFGGVYEYVRDYCHLSVETIDEIKAALLTHPER